jgi:hypothetical protein
MLQRNSVLEHQSHSGQEWSADSVWQIGPKILITLDSLSTFVQMVPGRELTSFGGIRVCQQVTIGSPFFLPGPASFCRKTRQEGSPPWIRRGSRSHRPRWGGLNNPGKAKPVSVWRPLPPPPRCCAPRPLLGRGGEFSCNPGVSQQKLATTLFSGIYPIGCIAARLPSSYPLSAGGKADVRLLPERSCYDTPSSE